MGNGIVSSRLPPHELRARASAAHLMASKAKKLELAFHPFHGFIVQFPLTVKLSCVE